MVLDSAKVGSMVLYSLWLAKGAPAGRLGPEGIHEDFGSTEVRSAPGLIAHVHWLFPDMTGALMGS